MIPEDLRDCRIGSREHPNMKPWLKQKYIQRDENPTMNMTYLFFVIESTKPVEVWIIPWIN